MLLNITIIVLSRNLLDNGAEQHGSGVTILPRLRRENSESDRQQIYIARKTRRART